MVVFLKEAHQDSQLILRLAPEKLGNQKLPEGKKTSRVPLSARDLNGDGDLASLEKHDQPNMNAEGEQQPAP